jgi:hypothetical protein
VSSTCTVTEGEIAVPAVVVLGCTLNASLLAVVAFTVKLLLVAPVNVPSEADKVKLPVAVGIRLLKVATPPEAATVSVELPLNTPPVLMAIVTFELSVVTGLPLASCTCTVTDGLIALPAAVVEGCWTTASLFDVPDVILNAVLVAEAKPLLVAVSW